MTDTNELIKRMRGLKFNYGSDEIVPVRMSDISALCDAVEGAIPALQELKRLVRAFIEASEKEAKASMSLVNAQENFSYHGPERSAHYKALMASCNALDALKKAIGAKP